MPLCSISFKASSKAMVTFNYGAISFQPSSSSRNKQPRMITQTPSAASSICLLMKTGINVTFVPTDRRFLPLQNMLLLFRIMQALLHLLNRTPLFP
jgi:hypothetical protein